MRELIVLPAGVCVCVLRKAGAPRAGRVTYLRLRIGWWAPTEVRFVAASLRQLVGGVTIPEAKKRQ